MEGQDRRTEIAELRQWIDWLAWRVGELERQEAATYSPVPPAAAQTATAQPAPEPAQPPEFQPVAPYPLTPQPMAPPVAAQPVAAQPVAAQPVPAQPVAAQPATGHWNLPHPGAHPGAHGPGPRQPRKPFSLEDLLSPERLAWAGGAMLVTGIAFLVSWGIHKGWITPTMRIAGAAVACLLLAGGALTLRRRGDEGAVPHAIAAVSIAGLFATLIAASVRYDMIESVPISLALASAIAGGGVYLSLVWNSQTLGGLAFAGAILAPALIDAPIDLETVAFVMIAYAAAMTLSAVRGWQWTGTAAIVLAVLIVPARLRDAEPLAAQLVTWSSLWAITQIGAFARVESETGKVIYTMTLFVSTAAFAGIGADLIEDLNTDVAHGWVAALAVAHAAMALAGARLRRIPELDWILAAILATIAAALIVSGVALVATWCALAAGIAWQTHASRPEKVRVLARIGATLLLLLAATKVVDATISDSMLDGTFETLTTDEILAVSGALASIFASALIWLWRERSEPEDVIGPALIPLVAATWAPAWAAAIMLEGAPLVCALVALGVLWQTAGRRAFGLGGAIASVAMLSVAATHVLVHEAVPYEMLVEGVDDFLAAAITLCVLALGCLAHVLRTGRTEKVTAVSLAALALVYLGSGAIIALFPPDVVNVGVEFEELVPGSGQTGQALLSAYWALVAFIAVIAGLRLRVKEIRIAGLSLLVIAILKILLFDLANLEAAYRTISFIVTGAVLLAAAFAFQRLRRDDEPPNAGGGVSEPTIETGS
ncbi:MAG: DUF2339 domain-containing protein [Actinobacteria bacterium]|nr:DUF2339 domain-containing protein [Actinomycetota bacterium]